MTICKNCIVRYQVAYKPELTEETVKLIKRRISPVMVGTTTKLYDIETAADILKNEIPAADRKLLDELLDDGLTYMEL